MTNVTHHCDRRARQQRDAFTLIEVLIALTIIGMAGSALLLATYAAMDTATDTLDQTIAQGIARQYLDEALGLAYVEAGGDPFSLQLGPESGEIVSTGRAGAFDDTDDYHAYEAKPLVDLHNQPLGVGNEQGGLRHPHFRLNSDHFHGWNLKSKVSYVDEDDPSQSASTGTASGLRMIEVWIFKRQADGPQLPLANMRRIFSYVPAPQ